MEKILKNNDSGFTIIELLIVIQILIIIFVIIVGFITVCKGNFWFTEEGVLYELKLERPSVTKLLKSDRGVWNYSELLVETEGGQRKTFCLDTNILFNYEFSDCGD